MSDWRYAGSPATSTIAFAIASGESGSTSTAASPAISGIEVVAAVYDTLTVPNTKDQMVPYLAKSVSHDAAYTTWTIVLRDGYVVADTPNFAQAIQALHASAEVEPVVQADPAH